jgi:HK97 family phage major capsid protein
VNVSINSVSKDLPSSVAFGRLVCAIAAGGAGRDRKQKALAWYRTNFGDGDNPVTAALTVSDQGSGGVTVPTTLGAQLIPLLQAQTVLGRAGVKRVPLPGGNITIVRSLTGAVFTRLAAEGDVVNASSPTFGAVTLAAKKMIGKFAVSNDLIRYSAYDISGETERDAVRGLQVAEDSDFLRGSGVGPIPKGLRNIATGSNLLTMTANWSVSTVALDLGRMVAALAASNVPMNKCFWAFAPRTRYFLRYLLNATGVKVFPEMADGLLLDFPYFDTTSIPINLGAGDETEIMFAAADQLIIGDGLNIQVDVSTEATYADENGNPVSAFDKDQTIVRILLANDFAAFHPQAAAAMTGVTWGA